MHFSRMRTVCSSSHWGGGSASVHAGIDPPRCGPGDPPTVGLETPGCGPGDPPSQIPLNFPLGVGLETPLARSLSTSPPGNQEGMLGYHLQCMLGYHPPSPEQNDRQVKKYYLAPNFVCGW